MDNFVLLIVVVGHSVDAKVEENRLGRLCNHVSGKSATAEVKGVVVNDIPHACLLAIRNFYVNEQVVYDYGVKIPFVDKVQESCNL